MYNKQLYVFVQGKPQLATIRNYTLQDFDALIDVQQHCFPPPFPSELWWSKAQLESHVNHFPQGALCIEINGQIVGSMTALLVHTQSCLHAHTWAHITDNGYIRSHTLDGDTLYIVDLCIHPQFRGAHLGKWLMFSMYELVISLNKERLLGGARMPNYYKYANAYTPMQYVNAVVAGELYDPVISFLLRCGRMPIQVIPNYLEDEESHHFGVLMEWRNPFLQLKEAHK